MPSSRATRRASSTASLPQHEPNRRVGSSDSFHGHTRMVTPTTSTPRSTRSAAATDESTPPDIPTTTREDMTATGSIINSPRTAGPQPRDVLRLVLRPRAEQFGEALELVGIGIRDLDRAEPLAAADADARHERALERRLDGRQLGRVPARRARAPHGAARRLDGARGLLGRAHGPRVRQDLVTQAKLIGLARQRQQHERMAHREPAAAQVGLDRLRQPQQPQRVGDRRAVAAHALRELLLCPAELREQLLIRLGLLHRVEVLAEKVLDERDLETLRIGRLTHDGGNPRQPRLARGAPAPLARNQLIARPMAAHDDRLNDPGGPDRGRKLTQGLGIKELSWLVRVDGDLIDRSEEHTSELQSHHDLVCRLLLEKKKKHLYSPALGHGLLGLCLYAHAT